MILFRYLLPLLLALAVPCWGQEVKLPSEVVVSVGQPVTVNAETDGEFVRWWVADYGLWMFDPDLQKTTKSAQVWSTTAGTYRLVAWTAKGGIPGKPVVCLVKVGKGPKPPDPPDPPGPEPDELTETGKKVYEWATAVGNKTETKQIGENYSSIVSAIAAGAYKELSFDDARAKIVSDLLQLNRKVSEGKLKWAEFSQKLAEYTVVVDSAGKLRTVDEIKTYFEEIQAGLEAASE